MESDAQGMMTATKAGYNPKSMVNFLRNLRRHEIMSGQAYHSFQASHPDTRDRIIKSDGLGESFFEQTLQAAPTSFTSAGFIPGSFGSISM